MDDSIPDFAKNLSAPEVRREFKIVSIVSESPDQVQFRLDPGPAFERTGRIIRTSSGDVVLRLFQRYRPDREMVLVAGTPLGESLTDGLRSVIRNANWPERRPHWRDAYRTQDPKLVRVRPVTGLGIISESFRAVTEAAREKNIAHYLWRAGAGKIAYGNNPPPAGVMFSVNPLGQWAFHAGRDTRPLETPPDLTALAPEPEAASQLAAQDLGTAAVAPIRSGNQEAAPADKPAPSRSARRR